ncbi:MAG: glycoside-pentoside-hexuronide (GPH):cation symporter [Akkermansiaceae bacterium]|nr:glycoside-pentoside-hexuronide (GPH):cation symporter [Akkermansiaceae bacterium]
MSLPSTSRLSVKEKVGYGLGDTASNFVFHVVNVFLLTYYTVVLGLSPAAVGTMFLVCRLWDAFSDPLMGAIADRTQTKMGKFRPYLLWFAIPFGIAGYLVFSVPDLGDAGKLVYAYITYIFLWTIYTAINVPYSALMGVMSPDPVERTSLSTYRFVGAFSAQLLIGMAFLPLVKLLGEGDDVAGYSQTMAVFSVIAVLLFFGAFFTTKERVKPKKGPKQSLGGDFSALSKNVPWIIMIVAAILTLSNVALRGGVTYHFLNYVVGADDSKYFLFLDRTSFFYTTGSLAFVTGVFFTGWVSRKMGKRNGLMILTILNGLTFIAFYFIPTSAYTTMILVNAIGSFLAGPTPALVWAIYTDVVDYGEWKFGRRTTALAFSAAMFSQKLGLAVGSGIGGWMLAYYGFKADVAPSQETLDGIKIMFSIIPGIFGIANGLVLLGYKLTDEQLETITADLAERRKTDE